jgi:hypothetical protein
MIASSFFKSRSSMESGSIAPLAPGIISNSDWMLPILRTRRTCSR